jgi:proteic killer suppression protein
LERFNWTGLNKLVDCRGYHDEPLHGEWKGYRSIRLNRSYRAVYSIQDDAFLEFVLVETVTKHEY